MLLMTQKSIQRKSTQCPDWEKLIIHRYLSLIRKNTFLCLILVKKEREDGFLMRENCHSKREDYSVIYWFSNLVYIRVI
jgi:hypothetical protein